MARAVLCWIGDQIALLALHFGSLTCRFRASTSANSGADFVTGAALNAGTDMSQIPLAPACKLANADFVPHVRKKIR